LGPSLATWRGWHPGSGLRGERLLGSGCVDPISTGLLAEFLRSIDVGEPSQYASTLTQIGLSLDCFTLDDIEALGNASTFALESAVSSLPTDVQDRGRIVLLNSLLNLHVITYDDAKVAGYSSLRKWMLSNLRRHKEIVARQDSIIRRTGLWLRSPPGDTFVQIKNLCEDAAARGVSTNHCVSLGHLLEALNSDWRLGLGNCMLSEMASPIFDIDSGYICQRDVCETLSSSSQAGTSQLGSTATALGQTQFGVDVQSLVGCGSHPDHAAARTSRRRGASVRSMAS
jgi:hypothetical protein